MTISRPMQPEAKIPRPRPCPICGKPPAPPHRPFCSARCRQIDLGRWLKGNYRFATEEVPEDEREAPEEP